MPVQNLGIKPVVKSAKQKNNLMYSEGLFHGYKTLDCDELVAHHSVILVHK